ncbi:MAG: hypothetical protein CO150_09065 [Nitrospirae bacterium CG_4_9_14_3_um_filter_53_35]|nr:MAG: hypothetical protein AUK29_00635 [Nitrospirae bacterium CG2_30_53_67]PIS36179.1 MAG: hypothetical protein COT35_12540 [Nitrospirae bacterium CG08_land_8_20_14_0_20_52_24]PIV82954.1 MAG: hypothetical protein COW52_10945 [Nitrospirae bacterium CG17_big_fil_post_rev_8_21_14_2_50_50_9]PIW84734.1 MAG: hypothetical protein COZ95_08305 [Nitrospirae bacterium CG_4_8_14_3_um_filter_50_41]PIX85918.1 MAG: hypothetical protein COZ32_06065 [Nitrospirae bacterium CG_4_10_14_3_um_filter_53_41]PJA7302
MKEEVWSFLLGQEDRFQEVSSESLNRLVNEEGSQVFPQLGGKVILAALVHMRCEHEKPKQVKRIEFRRCRLTKDGFPDPAFKERRKQIIAEIASIQPQKLGYPNVVDASQRFKERRFQNEFSWTPSVSMVQQLSAMIHEKTKGALGSREIMYQILQLTATA